MSRAPSAEDLYALRVPMEVRISPDAERIAFSVKESNPDKDGYRTAIWLVPADGSTPARKVTLGAKSDSAPRWSPDGRTLAFLSDRSSILRAGGGDDRPKGANPGTPGKPDEDATQVWLLPMDGGEARQLTRLPLSVSDLAWSPDSSRLCVVSAATSATRPRKSREPGDPPDGDARLIDRLQSMSNGIGFVYDKPSNLWSVDVADGSTKRITSGTAFDESPVWSPDGTRVCFVSRRHPDSDLTWRYDLYLVGAEGGAVTQVTGGRGDRAFSLPAWSPDGRWIAAAGHRYPAGGASRNDVWLFRPQRNDAGENVTAPSDLMIGAGLGSDLFGFADPRLFWSGDGKWIAFAAPIDGAYELWGVSVGDRTVQQLTRGDHAITRPDAARHGKGLRVASVTMSGDETPDVAVFDLAGPGSGRKAPTPARPRRVSALMQPAWGDVKMSTPVSRWHETDGRRIQGWFLQAEPRGGKPAPLVLEIHGGPATLYGWSMFWEWQVLVAAGISVYACNPRGSQGYGQDFCHANFADWGDGPMRDVMDGIDSLIADGLADPDRLGVTGGSYGGYLTSWMVGHTDRFKAAVSCRSVNDMTSEMLSGDSAGPLFGLYEYGVNPWEDPDLYWRHSPIAYARDIHTPLLIQHAEKDLRCPITQGEELFTVLRSLKRDVRFMRVPDESHELTRSGAPFRRVENINRIRDWFVHYLIDGKRGMPPVGLRH